MTTTPTRVTCWPREHGLDPVGTIVWSPTTAQLYTAALKSGDGALAARRPARRRHRQVHGALAEGQVRRRGARLAGPDLVGRDQPAAARGQVRAACARRSSSTSRRRIRSTSSMPSPAPTRPPHRRSRRHRQPLPRALREDDVHHACRRRSCGRFAPDVRRAARAGGRGRPGDRRHPHRHVRRRSIRRRARC